MFNLFKKKKEKQIIISCDTDRIKVNDLELTFPTSRYQLMKIFGTPTRELSKSNNYMLWDGIGVFCGYSDKDHILSINVYQNKEDETEYNTKKQFKGKLILGEDEITNSEFVKIALGDVAIHRLGSENEIRYGFSLGSNKDFKH